MKKIMVMFLAVALMSSFASAALITPQINGQVVTELTLAPSDTIVIDLVTDAPLLDLDAYVELSLDGPGTLDMTQLTYPSGSDAAFQLVREIEAGRQYELANGSFTGLNGVAIDHIVFHCDGPGDVLLTLRDATDGLGGGTFGLDGSTNHEFGSILIHQVPEPMTLSLLGLGGLGLLRRRRA